MDPVTLWDAIRLNNSSQLFRAQGDRLFHNDNFRLVLLWLDVSSVRVTRAHLGYIVVLRILSVSQIRYPRLQVLFLFVAIRLPHPQWHPQLSSRRLSQYTHPMATTSPKEPWTPVKTTSKSLGGRDQQSSKMPLWRLAFACLSSHPIWSR